MLDANHTLKTVIGVAAVTTLMTGRPSIMITAIAVGGMALGEAVLPDIL